MRASRQVAALAAACLLIPAVQACRCGGPRGLAQGRIAAPQAGKGDPAALPDGPGDVLDVSAQDASGAQDSSGAQGSPDAHDASDVQDASESPAGDSPDSLEAAIEACPGFKGYSYDVTDVDLDADGENEALVRVGYEDGSDWVLLGGPGRGFAKMLEDPSGNSSVSIARLPDGRLALLNVNDCCCQYRLSIWMLDPGTSDPVGLFDYEAACSAVEGCRDGYTARVVYSGTGPSKVLESVDLPKDCDGKEYEKHAVSSMLAEKATGS